ncbi:hypothetical protein INR49_012523 [Caranx melampygus]|nr:hypothetical protein INR49_012523 [Caranx melampygus]
MEPRCGGRKKRRKQESDSGGPDPSVVSETQAVTARDLRVEQFKSPTLSWLAPVEEEEEEEEEEPWKKGNKKKSRRLNKPNMESKGREQGKEVKVIADRVFHVGAGGRHRETGIGEVGKV